LLHGVPGLVLDNPWHLDSDPLLAPFAAVRGAAQHPVDARRVPPLALLGSHTARVQRHRQLIRGLAVEAALEDVPNDFRSVIID
jgi:hypothetical protein